MEEIVITLFLLLHYISIVNKTSRGSIVGKGARVPGLQMLIMLLGNMQCSWLCENWLQFIDTEW